MRRFIGINTLTTGVRKAGVGVYITNLIQELQKLDTDHWYLVFIAPETASLFPITSSYFRLVECRVPQQRAQRALWQVTHFPLIVRELNLDLVHLPNSMPYLQMRKGRQDVSVLMTIHDLAEFHVRKYGFWRTRYRRFMIRNTVKRASWVVTDSESSRQDIIRLLHYPPGRVTAIPLGVAPSFCILDKNDARSFVMHRYGIDRPYLLSVGQIEPGKNLPRLLAGFKTLVEKHGSRHKLVIVGERAWGYSAVERMIQRFELENDVHLTGYVPEEDLPWLYNAADLFVCPSLYEGFGLPVAEAMACGVPVVVSNCSSLPEIIGKAGLSFDPYDVNDMVNSILEILDNLTLKARLVAEGLKRVSVFSWQYTAEQTLSLYRTVLGEN